MSNESISKGIKGHKLNKAMVGFREISLGPYYATQRRNTVIKSTVVLAMAYACRSSIMPGVDRRWRPAATRTFTAEAD